MFNDNAISTRLRPPTNCVATTKNFLVLYISSIGLQIGFRVQGQASRLITSVVTAFFTPMS